MQNFQHFGGGGIFIRLYDFDLAGSVINVSTFAPINGQFLTDPNNQFTLSLTF